MAVTSKILVDRQTSSMRPHLRLFKAVRVRAPRTLDNVTITMKPTIIASAAMQVICNKMVESHIFNLLSKPRSRTQDPIRDTRTTSCLINNLLLDLHRAVTLVSTCRTVHEKMRLITSEQEFLTRLHESMQTTSTDRDRRYQLQTEKNSNVADSLNWGHKTLEKQAGHIIATNRPGHNTTLVLHLHRHSTSHITHSMRNITNVQIIIRGHREQSQPLHLILVPENLPSQQVS